MSEIKTNPIPISKPIRYSKSWHAFSNPDCGLQKYFFALTITLNNKEQYIFKKVVTNKYVELITPNDNIKYNNIQQFTLSVVKLSFNNINNYELVVFITKLNSAKEQIRE